MFRSSSRNQRSKGVKIKQVLQICLLLAVCFWLIYQVKHSHDKKKEFDENNLKISLKTLGDNEILKYGRKDLHPRVEETTTENEKHDEEEAGEEETGGEEQIKHEEEEEQEEDSKIEEKEDEERGGGDDEIDERDQEKSGIGDEEDIIGEEEREEGDERESEEKDAEGKDGQIENESSLDQDHDSGRNTHEAREEHYKADDASSAVTHASNENTEMISLEQENKVNNTKEIDVGQNTTGLLVGDGEMAENGTRLNATTNGEKGFEILLSKSEDSTLLNSTILIESNNQLEVSINSTEVSKENHGLTLLNGTETTPNSTQAQNATVESSTSGEGSNLQTTSLEQANNSIVPFDNSQSDFSSTFSTKTETAEPVTTGDFSNSSANSESVISGEVIRSNASTETEDSSGSSTTEDIDATQNEKSDTSDEMNETNESSKIENEDGAQHDDIVSSDSSILLEEKEIRTDLDTLPEIRTEGTNSEEIAEE